MSEAKQEIRILLNLRTALIELAEQKGYTIEINRMLEEIDYKVYHISSLVWGN